ncbi:hypothetical protein CVT26_002559 [Gymnopilus dilepis]|uniref:Reverse transcriptase domain-containing protein n=1 Tax=Gymnopilus dilepis TaxID=231916 RepID=A0A409VSV5_9AGAR|nr:hypothetical protein CVT26_002559 [Gymnopilus dilepis]
MIILSLSPDGLQRHLHTLHQWCKDNYLVLSAPKSAIMIFGPIPRSLPVFHIDNVPLPFTDTFKYVGIVFKSTTRDYFSAHYDRMATLARSSAQALFKLELYVGRNRIPPAVARMLYCATVDCHLISGSDVAPDVSQTAIQDLSRVQKRVLRRILLVSKHTPTAPLFTETGIMPVGPRRVLVLLHALAYYIQQPPTDLLTLALKQAHILRLKKKFNYLSDADYALQTASHSTLSLPSLPHLTPEVIAQLQKDLKNHVWSYLEQEIQQNRRLYLLHDRLEPLQDGSYKHIRSTLRHYLVQVSVPAHRRSLTKLLFGESIYYSMSLHGVSDAQRTCRMCHGHIETPEHALLQCWANERVAAIRRTFTSTLGIAQIYHPVLPLSDESAVFWLKKLIFHYDIVPLTAQFVHNVYRVWSGRQLAADNEENDGGEDDSEIEDGEMDVNENDDDDI